ncbi:MAG: chemotaxis protein CheW [Alphaproteobacteria bacterium]|nr:chemotaxis protein CheW [Alphaproteobacteria bacterium]
MTNNNLPTVASGKSVQEEQGVSNEFVTMTVAGQLFGIPVLQVQDVLGEQKITRVPLSPKEVAGSLNLRGRIVTAFDVRTRLGLPPRDKSEANMSVVVDHGGEFYSLIIDKVGEVMSLPAADYEKSPSTLSEQWREISGGIYRLKDNLLIVLDVARLLHIDEAAA